jgi:uncharacterized membrane protein
MLAERNVRRWTAAGLIDAATAEKILAWEGAQRGSVWLWAVAGMGALAIGLGVLALVGANWEHIPAAVKLGVMLTLVAAMAAATAETWRREMTWPREIAALLLFGLVIAGIALIGQVYHLQSATWRALVLWLLLSTPFLALVTRTRLVAAIWAAAALATWFSADEPVRAALAAIGVAPTSSGRSVWSGDWVWALLFYLPCCWMAAAGIARRLWAPTRAQGDLLLGLAFAGFAGVVSFAIALGAMLPLRGEWRSTVMLGLLATLALAPIVWFGVNPARRRAALLFVAVSAAAWAMALPLEDWLSTGKRAAPAQALRAGLFIAYWAFIGWLASREGRRTLFGVAFTMIALRILVVYLEAIGGLTGTGAGLIGGGLLCLALAAVGWKLTKRVPKGAAP